MAATRTPRSRGPRKASAGLHWDQAQLTPIILIRTDGEVLTNRAARSLLAQAKVKDPTAEITRLEVATYGPHQLDTLVSPSLFDELRLVYVPALEQMADTLLSDLIAYVGAAGPEVSIILRCNGDRRGKRLLDVVEASLYPTIQREAIKSAKDKSSLVVADVCCAGRSTTPEAVGALVNALGSDPRELCSAVNQLLIDTQGTINVNYVRTYYTGRIEATDFTVADTAVAGNTPVAITALRHAVAIDTDPATIAAALAMGVRQLTWVTAAGGRRMSPVELGMAPWQVDRAHHELQGWSDDALATSILTVTRAGVETKGTSRDPVYAIERAILATCSVRRSSSHRR